MALADITASLENDVSNAGGKIKDVLSKSASEIGLSGKTLQSNIDKFEGKLDESLTDAALGLSAKAGELESSAELNKVKFEKASSLFISSFSNFGNTFKAQKKTVIEKANKEVESTAKSYSSIFGEGSNALKTLTGGLVDLQDMYDDAAKSIQAFGTILTTPFKLANTAVAKTTKFFTGKEVNIGDKLKKVFVGTGEKIDEESDEVDKGLFGKFSDGIANFKTNIIAGTKAIGLTLKKSLKTGFLALKNGIFMVGKQFMAMGARLIAGIIPLITASAAFIAGLLATGVSLLVAAAPFIGIAILIGLAVAAVVMAAKFIYDKFIENKDLIVAKFTAMKEKIASVIGSITGFFTNIWQGISDFIREKFLKIKSFLGLTSDAEEEELAQIKQRKAEQKARQDQAEEAAKEQMAALEESGELDGMSRREKRKKRKELEKAELARIEEQEKLDATGSQELLDRRDESYKKSENFDKIVADREAFIAEKELSDAGAAKVRAGEMDNFVYGMGRDVEGGKFDPDDTGGVSSDAYRAASDDATMDAFRMESELRGRSDFVQGQNISEEEDAALMKKFGVTEDDLSPEMLTSGTDDNVEAYLAERERMSGDRIKDSRDQAEEAAEQVAGQVAVNTNTVQQNVSNNSNTFMQTRPNPQNNEPTGTRLSAVPA